MTIPTTVVLPARESSVRWTAAGAAPALDPDRRTALDHDRDVHDLALHVEVGLGRDVHVREAVVPVAPGDVHQALRDRGPVEPLAGVGLDHLAQLALQRFCAGDDLGQAGEAGPFSGQFHPQPALSRGSPL